MYLEKLSRYTQTLPWGDNSSQVIQHRGGSPGLISRQVINTGEGPPLYLDRLSRHREDWVYLDRLSTQGRVGCI